MNSPDFIAAALAHGQNAPPGPQVGTKRPHAGGSAAAHDLDQYYTKHSVAADLYRAFKMLYNTNLFQMVEPSAGRGAFSDRLPYCRWAFDLDPKGKRITKADFLKTELRSAREIAVIGNPPFGKNASMAIRFFNHAAKSARIIAYIVPKSFRKASIINRLNPYFHLVHERTVERDAFIFDSRPCDVPCMFQIWERRAYRRAPRTVETWHRDFAFTTGALANFAIQRVGVNAGRVHDGLTRSSSAHYFIRGDVKGAMKALESQFRSVAADVAGCPSLAKSEIVTLYRDYTEAG